GQGPYQPRRANDRTDHHIDIWVGDHRVNTVRSLEQPRLAQSSRIQTIGNVLVCHANPARSMPSGLLKKALPAGMRTQSDCLQALGQLLNDIDTVSPDGAGRSQDDHAPALSWRPSR